MVYDESLAMIFAEPILEMIEFYSVCNNHRWHHGNSCSFPMKRFDIRTILWKIDLPDDDGGELETRILRDWFDDFSNFEAANFEEEHGFEIGFDVNGYRLLAKLPVYELLEEKESLRNDLEIFNLEVDDVEYIEERLSEIDDELVDCAKKHEIFLKYVEGMKDWERCWFEDFVVVVNDDGDYAFVSREEYEDFKVERRWKLWKKKKG